MEELEKALEKKESMSFDDLQNLSQQADDIKAQIESRLKQIKRKLWIQKVHLLKSYKESKVVPNNPISLTQLKNCLLEGNEYLSNKEAAHEIQYMEYLLKEVEDYMNTLSNTKDSKMLEGIEYMLYGFVYIREEIINFKANIVVASANEDLHMGSIINLEDEDGEEILAQRDTKKKEAWKEGKDMQVGAFPGTLTGKRKSMTMKPKGQGSDSEHQDHEKFAMDKHDKYDKVNKMIKKDTGNSIKKQYKKKKSEEYKEVIDEDRKKAKLSLFKALNANDYFKEVKHQEEIAKKVEMDIFSELSGRLDTYRKNVRRIVSLFFECREYEMISNKLVKSNFSCSEIKKIRKTMGRKELEKQLMQEAMNNNLRNHIIAAEKEFEKADLLEDSFEAKPKIFCDSIEAIKENKEKSQDMPSNGKVQSNKKSRKMRRRKIKKRKRISMGEKFMESQRMEEEESI